MNILEQMMEINLNQVWSQRDPHLRLQAIKSLYAQDAVLYEIGEEINGHETINYRVTALLGSLPPDFKFKAQKPGGVNKDMGRLLWTVGPEGSRLRNPAWTLFFLKRSGSSCFTYILINNRQLKACHAQ